VAAVGSELVIAPLAHVGHWAINLLYVAPLLIAVGVLGYQSLKDRRQLKRGEVPPRRPPEDVGPTSG
jgi:hypothetical protein